MSPRKNLRLRYAAVPVFLISVLAACGGGSDSSYTGGGGGSGGGGGTEATFYEPFSSASSGKFSGLWLIDVNQPSVAPIRITTAAIDVPDNGAGPSFYDWTYHASTGQRSSMALRFFAYGSGGHLYGVDLTQGAARQLSNGKFDTLCSALAVQTGPFSSAKSYVVARVALAGSSTCTTTWIIPTDAGSGDAPTPVSQSLVFLAGLNDPASGLATGFVVNTGSEVDLYSTSLRKATTLIPSLPTGAQVSLLNLASYMGPVLGLVVETGTQGSTPVQDDVYLVDSKQASLVGSYTLPATPSCGVAISSPPIGFVQGALSASTLLYTVRDPSGGVGFTVQSVPLTGGTPTTVYSDATGCGTPFVDRLSDGRLVMDYFDSSSSEDKYVSISITGPAGQTPVTLAIDSPNNFAFVDYVIGGNAWVNDFSLDSTTGDVTDISARVVDLSNGHVLKSYAHSDIGGDFWNGFYADGTVSRGPVLIESGTTTSTCELKIASFAAVDPETFASNSVSASGSPCRGLLFGPAPLAIGPLGKTFYYLSKTTAGGLSFGKVAATAPTGSSFLGVFGEPIF